MRRVFPIGCALFFPFHGGMGAAQSLEGCLPTFECPYLSTVDLILGRRLWWRGQVCRDVSSMLTMQEQDKWLTNFVLGKAWSVTHRLAVYLFGIDRSWRFSSSPWTSAQEACGLQRASLDLQGGDETMMQLNNCRRSVKCVYFSGAWKWYFTT